ncbi:hypothetical protein KXW38_008804, partial [Aspergillus fumigatus]
RGGEYRHPREGRHAAGPLQRSDRSRPACLQGWPAFVPQGRDRHPRHRSGRDRERRRGRRTGGLARDHQHPQPHPGTGGPGRRATAM